MNGLKRRSRDSLSGSFNERERRLGELTREFIEAYNREWLLERHGHRPPAEVRQGLYSSGSMIKLPLCPINRVLYRLNQLP